MTPPSPVEDTEVPLRDVVKDCLLHRGNPRYPTITIIPVEGEEFTKRILSPVEARKVAFLFRQGVEPAILLRLMGQELVLKKETGFSVLRNDPAEVAQYTEFRRRVLHISSLKFWEGLHVGRIFYQEVLPISFPEDSAAPEVLQALDEVLEAAEKGYQWTRITDSGPLVLTRQVLGRLAITNYDLSGLPNEERESLNNEAKLFPENSLLVDIRPGGPGGDYPLQGYFLFRSFSDTLVFVASGMTTVPEFDVEKHPKTSVVLLNPAQTLAIEETEEEPADAAFKVKQT